MVSRAIDKASSAWVRVWIMEVAVEFCNRLTVSMFIDACEQNDLTKFEMTPILTVLMR